MVARTFHLLIRFLKVLGINKTSSIDHTALRDSMMNSSVYPLKPSFPPIDYGDLTLTKPQILQINSYLVKD